MLTWDGIGEKRFETGVDHGVLYMPNEEGVYDDGVAWNGLTGVSQTPTGAESNKTYADNIVYGNLISAEEFGATVTAYTYPDEFAAFNGEVIVAPGVTIGQQLRRTFGFSYRSLVGDDIVGQAAGYKLHLVYGLTAAPSSFCLCVYRPTGGSTGTRGRACRPAHGPAARMARAAGLVCVGPVKARSCSCPGLAYDSGRTHDLPGQAQARGRRLPITPARVKTSTRQP